MDKILQLFGTSEAGSLTALQMSVRAFCMFFIALALIRIAGIRAFGKKSAFDTILVIMMGAILGRGVYKPELLATVSASAVMVLIHRALAYIAIKNKTICNLIKGESILLYKNGKIIEHNMRRSCMSKNDLLESLRLETKKDTLDGIEAAYMETNGRISFIEK